MAGRLKTVHVSNRAAMVGEFTPPRTTLHGLYRCWMGVNHGLVDWNETRVPLECMPWHVCQSPVQVTPMGESSTCL